MAWWHRIPADVDALRERRDDALEAIDTDRRRAERADELIARTELFAPRSGTVTAAPCAPPVEHAFNYVESDVPAGLTLAQWRRGMGS